MHLPVKFLLLSLLFLSALPPIWRLSYKWKRIPNLPSRWRDRVVARYQRIGTNSWAFSFWKLRLDPLCDQLHAFLDGQGSVRTALDIGCGYGIPGCSLLEWFPEVTVFGIDPMARRVKVAMSAFAGRGYAVQKAAPDIDVPSFPPVFDVVFMIDVIHFLSEEELDETLQKIHSKLGAEGQLFVRAIMFPQSRRSIIWNLEHIKQRLRRKRLYYRSIDSIRSKFNACGFNLEEGGRFDGDPEMTWFISRSRQYPAAK